MLQHSTYSTLSLKLLHISSIHSLRVDNLRSELLSVIQTDTSFHNTESTLSQFFFQIVDILKSTASSGHLSQVGETQMAENIEPGEEKQPGR
jgi:hypothetical protein